MENKVRFGASSLGRRGGIYLPALPTARVVGREKEPERRGAFLYFKSNKRRLKE